MFGSGESAKVATASAGLAAVEERAGDTMILPIGQEDNRVFRRPWVTYGIMILCTALFFLTHFTSQRRMEAALENLRQAVEYCREHPYLAPDPRLSAILRAQPDALEPEASPKKALDGEFSRLEQVELDGLTRTGFDALDDLPERRLGLVPARFSLLGLLAYMFMHAGLLHLLGNMLFLYL